MELPLSQFKSKIQEALVLVPDMTGDHRVLAVDYWNSVSEELQDIVNVNSTRFVGLSDSSIQNQGDATIAQNQASSLQEQLSSNMELSGAHDDAMPTETEDFVSNFYDLLDTPESIDCIGTLRGDADVDPSNGLLDKSLEQSGKLQPLSKPESILVTDEQTTPKQDKSLQSSSIGGPIRNGNSMFARPRPYDPMGTLSKNVIGFSSTETSPSMLSSDAALSDHVSDFQCIEPNCSSESVNMSVARLPIGSMSSSALCLASQSPITSGYVTTYVDDPKSAAIQSPESAGCVPVVQPLYTVQSNCPMDIQSVLASRQGRVIPSHAPSNSSGAIINSMNLKHGNLELRASNLGPAPIQSGLDSVSDGSGFLPQGIEPELGVNSIQAEFLECDICEKKCDSGSEILDHRASHSPHPRNSGLIDGYSISSTNICMTSQGYDGDQSSNLNIKEVPTHAHQQHMCNICGKSGFSTKGNLKRHTASHLNLKPFKCDHCEARFTEKKSLKIHNRRHTGEKPYKCDSCGKSFSQTGVLQSHMALHLDERKFGCNMCGKAFRQRSQLKLHIMRHEGVKRLQCSTCSAKFLTKGDMVRHQRVHTGERPYLCNICKKTFTRQQSLNEHYNRHKGYRPYSCQYCDKSFSEMSACYKHAKTHKK